MKQAESIVLTISVAAYNVESYIYDALSSLCIPGVDGRLEVLVVVDGATDGTAAIARDFARRKPDVFRVIEKENGGYGSTVNTGVAEARGRYFKILDGDDWMQVDDLSRLLLILEETDVDLVLTDRRKYAWDGKNISEDFVLSKGYPKDWCDRVVAPGEVGFMMGHWHLTVRTKVLRGFVRPLLEHILYTDQIFTLGALAGARTMLVTDLAPYCYRVGVEGQSVSLESRIEHADDLWRVTLECMRIAHEDTREDNRAFAVRRAAGYYVSYLMTLMLTSPSREMRLRIKEVDGYVKREFPKVYKDSSRISERVVLLRGTGYFGYWILEIIGMENWA